MKILHITRSLIVNSGVSVFVAELAGAQAELGHEVHLRYTWLLEYPVNEKVDSKTFKSLDELGFVPDVVHIHAFWSMDMIRAMKWCRKHNVPYVVSPHGGLMPRVLSKGWLKKHVFYWFFLKKNLCNAVAIHCTGEGEVAAVKVLGLRTPTFIAPLGCHLPEWPVKKLPDKKKTVLFLSRISEEKGLAYLLDAWKNVSPKGWQLIIAGPDWRGYRQVLERKVAAESIHGIEFVGPADVQMKARLYRTADLFVLPSPMENFSMVVLDALAYGILVICTKGTPWGSIMVQDCGWWVEPNSVDALSRALQEAVTLTEEQRLSKGVRSRRLAAGYAWGVIGKETVCWYQKKMAQASNDSDRRRTRDAL